MNQKFWLGQAIRVTTFVKQIPQIEVMNAVQSKTFSKIHSQVLNRRLFLKAETKHY